MAQRWLLALAVFAAAATPALSPAWAAGIAVRDDLGHDIYLRQPARRIVSLSPHATELLYAAGAGAYVIGVSQHSDFPPAARTVTSVGSLGAVDIEKILTLKPDLIVAWHSGNAAGQLQRLRSFGVPVFESEPTDYGAIASSLERLSRLSGTEAVGGNNAAAFRARWQTLAQTYRDRSAVSVFYQIWGQPPMTLNGKHMASSVLRTCGGRNIFAGLPQLAPAVGIESVVAADPDAILTPDDTAGTPLDGWRRFGAMKAVAAGNLYTVNADWMNRPGPRILEATAQVCDILEAVRRKRRSSP